MPDPTFRGSQIWEDIGALKALVASIDAKLDAGTEEFRSIRGDQIKMQLEVSEIKGASLTRVQSMQRIEQSMEKMEKRVDDLMTLRNRVGGAVFFMMLLTSGIYEMWGVLGKFIMHLYDVGK